MNRELIKRFLDGSYTENDQDLIYNWLVSNNKEHEANALLKQHWETVDRSKTLVDVDLKGIYKQILIQIEEDKVRQILDRKVNNVLEMPKRQSIWIGLMKYAAVIICAFGLGYFAFSEQEEIMVPNEEITIIEKVTSRGQKSNIILRDGSKIILNSDTRVTYDKDFGITNRNIELIGEAYFEVAKNKDLPFSVAANNTTTTAIGTAFNISAFREASTTTISLASGKVKVVSEGNDSNPDSEVLLEPGQEYLVDENNEGAIVRSFEANYVLSWKDNILYFDNTRMQELIPKLERWYNVKVIVLNPQAMTGVRGTGQFINESLENVLKVLSYSLQFDYQLKEGKVTVTFN